MGWAANHIEKLKAGETIQFRPRGHSMSGKIDSGNLVTVEPADLASIQVGDIVLCKVHGREFLHIVKAIRGAQFQIGNNRGGINGWITGGQIYGKCVKVEA